MFWLWKLLCAFSWLFKYSRKSAFLDQDFVFLCFDFMQHYHVFICFGQFAENKFMLIFVSWLFRSCFVSSWTYAVKILVLHFNVFLVFAINYGCIPIVVADSYHQDIHLGLTGLYKEIHTYRSILTHIKRGICMLFLDIVGESLISDVICICISLTLQLCVIDCLDACGLYL